MRKSHCNGCGTAEGQPRITYRNRRTVNGQVERVQDRSVPVHLTEVDFLDYGTRWLCQFCARGAAEEESRISDSYSGFRRMRGRRRDEAQGPELL